MENDDKSEESTEDEVTDMKLKLSEKTASEYRDGLRTVYQSIMSSSIDFRTRMWESIKTTSLLVTGALVAVGGLVSNQAIPPNPTWWSSLLESE